MIKKLILGIVVLLTIGIKEASCKILSTNPFSPSKEGLDEITSLSRTTSLLGIASMQKIDSEEGVMRYEIKAFPKSINEMQRNLNGARFSYQIESDVIRLIFEESDRKMSFEKKGDNIVYLERGISLETDESELSDLEITNFAIAAILYNELINPDIIKLAPEDVIILASKTCEKEMISIWHKKSVAIAKNNEAVDKFLATHLDCKRVYGQDVSCLWGDHWCVATQDIQCNGKSCD